jgi:hypothetical protein
LIVVSRGFIIVFCVVSFAIFLLCTCDSSIRYVYLGWCVDATFFGAVFKSFLNFFTWSIDDARNSCGGKCMLQIFEELSSVGADSKV